MMAAGTAETREERKMKKTCEGSNADVTTDTERKPSGLSWARCSVCGRKVRVVTPSLAAMFSNHISGTLYAFHQIAAGFTGGTK